VIEQLLPSRVVSVETYGDPEAELFPEEAEVVSRAVPKRRREFAAVRHCARAALARLGVAPAPILPGERGAPRWPDGVVGSMTHCDGYRAAAVASDGDVLALGIDAEPHAVLPDGVLAAVALPEEIPVLDRLAVRWPSVSWDRLLFSVKESVYKAWFPVTGRWLDFTEARVDFDPDGRFTVRLLTDQGLPVGDQELTTLEGRWLVERNLVLSAVVVSAG
jgi:Phosphopantetheinyl transferase component of siderophore synthetase